MLEMMSTLYNYVKILRPYHNEAKNFRHFLCFEYIRFWGVQGLKLTCCWMGKESIFFLDCMIKTRNSFFSSSFDFSYSSHHMS